MLWLGKGMAVVAENKKKNGTPRFGGKFWPSNFI